MTAGGRRLSLTTTIIDHWDDGGREATIIDHWDDGGREATVVIVRSWNSNMVRSYYNWFRHERVRLCVYAELSQTKSGSGLWSRDWTRPVQYFTAKREHVITTFSTEVDSAALLTLKNMGRGRRFFIKVTRKFTVYNSRKTKSEHSCPEMFDLVFLELLTLNFRVTFTKNLRPPTRVFWRRQPSASDLRSKCRECRDTSQHFERKSIAQCCRRQNTRAGAVVE